jgi:hypothetical protein
MKVQNLKEMEKTNQAMRFSHTRIISGENVI